MAEPESIEPDRFEGTPHPREQFRLVGHADAENAFVEAIRSSRLHHAWLIGGPAGIGKATLAYRVARRVLALRPGEGARVADLDLPADSTVARQVGALSHPNLVVLRRQPPSERKPASAIINVDAVRRARTVFERTAADGGHRVCIVDSAEDLNAASANALLKVVEEPPPHTLFLIVSHAPQRLLPTIRSRCRRLLLRPLDEPHIRAVIGSLGPPWSEIEEELLAGAVRLGDGSVRRTLELLERDRIELAARVTAALDALPSVDDRAVLGLAEDLARKDAGPLYELALDTVDRWIGERIRMGAGAGAARLAPLVEVCEKVARTAREIDIYNLDRRPLVLSLFDDLADAIRRTG
ncbi:DNA polymerase III subunit delta' [Microvirga massiliensis]|uniref:DNA polymerase III subunit delta' n=1 Tax=Microvirga massiliensis TaxID=1033741 RepID=UPI00062BA4BD|nr:DNA polymerase III subunit delta' [Microvirga massiliensis]